MFKTFHRSIYGIHGAMVVRTRDCWDPGKIPGVFSCGINMRFLGLFSNKNLLFLHSWRQIYWKWCSTELRMEWVELERKKWCVCLSAHVYIFNMVYVCLPVFTFSC
jgi:hypothetical protein